MKLRWMIPLFLLLNLATASRYPAVWVDEVQFSDPAVRLAGGAGFTSTAWFAQRSDEFFAGNVPLYSLLLSGWVRAFGVSPVAVRSLNYALAALLCLLLCRLALSRGWLSQDRSTLLAALILAGHSVMFSFRMGRYDVLSMCLFALGAWAWAQPSLRRSLPGLVAIGALLPWAGLQTLPAAVVYCALLWLLLGRGALWRGMAVGAGAVAGSAALFWLYWSHGVWTAFRASTSGIGLIGQSVAQKLAHLPAAYLSDKSAACLIVAACLLAWRGRTRLLTFALACAVLLPAALHLAGKFPVYYGWMTYLPLAVAVAAGLEAAPRGRVRAAAFACAALAVTVGLPARMAAVAIQWRDRDPRAVEQMIDGARIGPADRVVADFKLYYALERRRVPLYLPTYLDAMTPAERASVTALLLRPEDAARATGILGGQWTPSGPEWTPAPRANRLIGKFLREFREEAYPLTLYRRPPGSMPDGPLSASGSYAGRQ